ncbi:MAG: ABC transporter ATP-binding protein [Clostridiales bacterium]|jgi:ABC-2 type transport system ATP-binding protein|nr:ABC transporter ATP-binding protein [Clostridiales bacterium]
MTTALKLEHISKTIGKKQILHDISFETYAGEVFGFLGPNGAGKTTTIKIIVGLLCLDEGAITVCGTALKNHFEKAMQNIGGIVENPEMYKYLTGMQNLRQYARMRGNVSQKRIDEVVEMVGLSNRIHEKVGHYSLGMRQRLGVAQSILHHPKVLILDEPTNGLDPAGIKELRDILKNLAHKEGVGVLVSSHLMSEMEMMCDRVGIIAEGKLIGVQTVEELISTSSGGKTGFVFTVSDVPRALELIAGLNQEATRLDGRRFQVALPSGETDEPVSAICAKLIGAGIGLYGAAPMENKKLEDVFIALTETGGKQIG